MRVLKLETEPLHTLRYFVGPGPRQASAVLPSYRAAVDGMPDELKAIVATADLQGIGHAAGSPQSDESLGVMVAAELELLRAQGRLPARDETAAILAGDFHPLADEGDVCDVWFAMADVCRWVAGVAGNHDAFGNSTSPGGARRALGRPGLHFLDDSVTTVDGCVIGGLSGIVSSMPGAWRRAEDRFAAAIARLADSGLDLLVSHDGPDVAGTNLSGWPAVRRALEASPATLLIRGHDAWRTPLAELANGTQVLNVEGSVVVLGPAAPAQ
jgi:Icc protein